MDTDRIEELVIRNSGQQFNGNDFRMLRNPGVYVFLLNDVPLYIGYSSCLLSRIGQKAHGQAQDAMKRCDKVLLYPCISDSAARELEKILICGLHPKFNRRQQGHWVLMQRLGIGNKSAQVYINSQPSGQLADQNSPITNADISSEPNS